jgi:CheY-like chemotaxis protein
MCNILVVEDHEDWQEILPDELLRAFDELGYPAPSIVVTETFIEANRLLKEKQWDLLVTDLGLGSRSRQLLGSRLVRTAQVLRVPAIAVSGSEPAYNQRDLDELQHQYGAAGFFTKLPFDSIGFIKKVQELVTSPISLNIPPIPPKDLKDDPYKDNLPSNHFALLIGIAQYKSINPLAKTTVDAEDLYTVLLNNGYPKENVILLRDDEATKSRISQSLDLIARRAKNEDTVALFFAGHGLQLKGGFHPGEYLCAVQADLNYLQDTCISNEELTRALQSIQAGRLVVFLDACHSGGMGTPRDPSASIKAGLSESFYQTLAQAKGRAIIAACQPDEFSYELEDMRNGLFTHYLLQGLRGGAATNGVVTISRLFAYVFEHVIRHGNRPSPYQRPYQSSVGEDFMIVAQPLEHAINGSGLS